MKPMSSGQHAGVREGLAALLDVLFLVALFFLVGLTGTDGSGMSLGSSLILAGLTYWASAWIFRVPVPVQPLKVLSFLCLILHPTAAEIEAGSLLMGLSLFLLGTTGGISRIGRVLTRQKKEGYRSAVGLYIRLIVAAGAGAVLVPILFPVLSTGAGFFPGVPGTDLPFWAMVALLVLPQLPVTIVNGLLLSVEESRRLSGSGALDERKLALFLGSVDLLACVVSAFPVCHGSGAFRYYRSLGVRTTRLPKIAGGVLVALGFFLPAHPLPHTPGSSLFWLLVLFLLGSLQYALGRGTRGTDSLSAPVRSSLGFLTGALVPALLLLSGFPLLALLFLSLPGSSAAAPLGSASERTPGEAISWFPGMEGGAFPGVRGRVFSKTRKPGPLDSVSGSGRLNGEGDPAGSGGSVKRVVPVSFSDSRGSIAPHSGGIFSPISPSPDVQAETGSPAFHEKSPGSLPGSSGADVALRRILAGLRRRARDLPPALLPVFLLLVLFRLRSDPTPFRFPVYPLFLRSFLPALSPPARAP